MNALADDLIEGALQHDDSAELRNPLLKIALVILPLALVLNEAFQHGGRGIALTLPQLVLLSFFLYIAAIVDLRAHNRGSFLRRTVVVGVIVALTVAGKTAQAAPADTARKLIAKVYGQLPIINWFSPRTWVLFFLLFVAIIAVKNLSSRDAIWLGRKILYSKLFTVYVVVVTAFCTLHTALPRLLAEDFQTARLRYWLRAGSNGHGRLTRLKLAFRTFIRAFLLDVEHIGDLVRSLILERGFFSETYIDRHGLHSGGADVVALVLLSAACFSAYIIRGL